MSIQTGRRDPPIAPVEPTFCADGIEFCIIAVGPKIVIELNNCKGHLDPGYITSARRLPQQLCNMDYGTVKTYNYEGYSFHCKVSNCSIYSERIVHIALAKTAYSPQVVFSFLRDTDSLFADFVREYNNRGEMPDVEKFMPTLKNKVRYYSADPTSIKIRQIREDASEVKDIMVQNIDEITKRGEALQNIADKTSTLTMKSREFRSAAKKTKRTFWWRDKKYLALLIAIIVILILALFVVLTIAGVIPPIWKWFGGGGGGGGGGDDDSDSQF